MRIAPFRLDVDAETAGLRDAAQDVVGEAGIELEGQLGGGPAA